MPAVWPEDDRPQSLGEEIANSVSHGVGLAAALVAVPILVVAAGRHGDTTTAIAAGIFGVTVVLLYLSSTLYHALPRHPAKRLFQVFDHCAIFLLIAGTYTPFTLGVLGGRLGWTLFGLVWTLAIGGITLKATGLLRHPWLSTGLYLAMGWIAVLATGPLLASMPAHGLLWLVAGGVAYTAGVLFFAADRLRYAHFVWHLFTMTGTACHFCAVLWYQA